MSKTEVFCAAAGVILGLLVLAALKARGTEEYVKPMYQDVYIDDFLYVAVAPSAWCDLTNTVERLKDLSAQRWKKEHETVQGRAMWHGAATNRIVGTTSVTWLYADGFTYTETDTNAVKKVRPPTAKKQPSGASAKPSMPALPPRLAEKRKKMKSRSGKIREVNAVFGPGGKLIRVEEN